MASNFSFSSDDSDDLSPQSDGEEDFQIYGEVQGYLFEPSRQRNADDPDSLEVDDAENPANNNSQPRVGNVEWCSCSNCVVMPTETESICCREKAQILGKMQAYEVEDLNCMIEHPGFVVNCLNSWVLEVAYLQFRHQYQQRLDFPQHEIYRHTAYRQLVRWCWGIVGRQHRIPLPSCLVKKIRDTFPSPEGQYTGFKWPSL